MRSSSKASPLLRRTVRNGGWALVVGVCLVVAWASSCPIPARAAAPRIMVISGGALPRPVILTDWADNTTIVQGNELQIDPSQLAARPYLSVSLFWGPQWDAYIAAGRPLAALDAAQPTQTGRIYPGVGGGPALLVLDAANGAPTSVRELSGLGAEVLADAGVDLTAEAASPSGLPATGWRQSANGDHFSVSAILLVLALLFAGATATWFSRTHSHSESS